MYHYCYIVFLQKIKFFMSVNKQDNDDLKKKKFKKREKKEREMMMIVSLVTH